MRGTESESRNPHHHDCSPPCVPCVSSPRQACVLHLNDTFLQVSLHCRGKKRRLEVKDLCDGMRGEAAAGGEEEGERGKRGAGTRKQSFRE